MKKYILLFALIVSANGFSQLTNNGATIVSENTTVSFSDAIINSNGATFINKGNMQLNNNFTNNGTFEIIPSATTIVNGNFQNTDTLIMQINGDTAGIANGFSQLSVNGNTDLGGTLTVNIDVTYTPVNGIIHTIISYTGNSSGDFATVNITPSSNWYFDASTAGQLNIIRGLLGIKLNPIAFFQGAYINPIPGEETWMRDNLRVASLIPTTSPYVDLLTCDVSVFTPTGANAIVDWVWVELRDKNDNTNILTSQSALLQRDGDIVAVDGSSPLSFNLANDNYFVVVSHRTHLGILSANTIALNSTVTNLDLSSSAGVVNGGTNAVVDLGNGIFALYAGDYDGNGQVQNTDLTTVRPLLGQPSSYDDADLDMNTQVQNTDLNNLLNPNKGRGQQAKMQDLKLYAKRKE